MAESRLNALGITLQPGKQRGGLLHEKIKTRALHAQAENACIGCPSGSCGVKYCAKCILFSRELAIVKPVGF